MEIFYCWGFEHSPGGKAAGISKVLVMLPCADTAALSPRCMGDLTQVQEGAVVVEQGTLQRVCVPGLTLLGFSCPDLGDTARVFRCVDAAEPGGGTSPSGEDAMQKDLGKMQAGGCNSGRVCRQGERWVSTARVVGC